MLELHIHPEAVEAFNGKALKLLAELEERPKSEFLRGGDTSTSDYYPRAVIQQDQMHGLKTGQVDIAGNYISEYALVGEQFIGFEEENWKSLQKLAEGILKQKGFSNIASRKCIEGLVFDWCVERYSNQIEIELCEYIVNHLQELVKEHWIWIPIFGITSHYDFELGMVEIHPVRSQFFETWHEQLRKCGFQENAIKAMTEDIRSTIQGFAACTIKVTAELERAQEIAFEEAESALAMLRIYLPTNLHPLAPSHCRPLKRHSVEENYCLVIRDDMPNLVQGSRSNVNLFCLDKELMDMMYSAGLGVLSKLYLKEPKTPFEVDLMKSILAYSKSSLSEDINNRLLFIFVALDSFLLKDTKENIQQNIADRIAFTISDDGAERGSIAEAVVSAYGLRSKIVHHNKMITELSIVEEFLGIVFRFFCGLVVRHNEYPSREALFSEVEKKKYA